MMFNASLVEDVDNSPKKNWGTITKLQNYLRKPYKKTIKSVIMIIPRGGGGGEAVSDQTFLGLFLQYFQPTLLA